MHGQQNITKKKKKPYVMFSLQVELLFVALKLNFFNSLKLKINSPHSKHSASALETFLILAIAVCSENYHEAQKYNALKKNTVFLSVLKRMAHAIISVL